MADWKIEGVFTAFRYCHRFMNDCPKKDVCLRCDRNVLKDWVSCVSSNLDCNEKNGYPYLLTEPPAEDELPKDYFGSIGDSYEEVEEQSEQEVKDESGVSESVSSQSKSEKVMETAGKVTEYLNDVVKHSRANFYIEPFVGNSSTISKVSGVKNVIGTDLDTYKIEVLSKNSKNSCQFKACDYKVWNKPLLSEDYKGKCIIYCEPPRKDSSEFKLEEFLSVTKEWAHKNKVFVRYSKLKRRKPVLTLGKDDFLYWM